MTLYIEVNEAKGAVLVDVLTVPVRRLNETAAVGAAAARIRPMSIV